MDDGTGSRRRLHDNAITRALEGGELGLMDLEAAGPRFLSPSAPSDHQVRLYGFVDELPELNTFLQRLAAAWRAGWRR